MHPSFGEMLDTSPLAERLCGVEMAARLSGRPCAQLREIEVALLVARA